MAVQAALLHDCVDDTEASLKDLRELFGDSVVQIVENVSRLSLINQLVRRRLRRASEARAGPPSPAAAQSSSLRERTERARGLREQRELRELVLSMVDEPLVLLVKLADRLHNMRTLHALEPPKRRAIAEETRGVWCSLAERLGMFALKAEMEDLCFAVLDPEAFDDIQLRLCRFWGLSETECSVDGEGGAADCLGGEDALGAGGVSRPSLTAEQQAMRRRLASVLPFDAQAYRELAFGPDAGGAPPLTRDSVPAFARAGLGTLAGAQRELLKKAALDAVAPECQMRMQGRVKSLYSIYRKMQRKGIGVESIFDALALRVVLSPPPAEEGGGETAEVLVPPPVTSPSEDAAVAACYRVLEAVQSLWEPVPGETDDYIANPKASGYQSLHTAVTGPGGLPFEVQIRTQSMHNFAELGAAAHWLYKEGIGSRAAGEAADGERPSTILAEGLMAAVGMGAGGDGVDDGNVIALPSPAQPFIREGEEESIDGSGAEGAGVEVGQPVLKVSEMRLRDGVVVATDAEGIQGALLVAVCRMGRLRRESQLGGRGGLGSGEMGPYVELLSTVELMGWRNSGQGNNSVGLELYVPCRDGRLHKQDAYGYKLKSYVTPLEVLPANGAGASGLGQSNLSEEQQRLQRKCRLMRSMLEWEKEAIEPPAGSMPTGEPAGFSRRGGDEEVLAVLWPGGEFMRLPRGTTAGQVEEASLLEGGDGVTPSRNTVWVNNRVVPPSTPIADGDLVSLREMTPAQSSLTEA